MRTEVQVDDQRSGLGWLPDGRLLVAAMQRRQVLRLDGDGHVWIANAIVPECVLVAPGGAIVATVATDQPCYACMLGGADRRTLFMMTAPSSVAEVQTPGAGRP